MPRFKDFDWDLRQGNNFGTAASWEDAKMAVLMDIRDELKVLNRVFKCPNFLAVPHKLDTIIKNTTKPRRRAKRA